MTAVTARTDTATTRTLLGCGVVAGPLFLVVALAQAYTRAGFDLRRHPFSMLSLGELGWLQITTFVVTGLLFTASAVGMRRVLRGRRGGAWGPALIGAFGVALIGGGVFVADPALGFPAGTGDGPPASLSWHGIVHGIAFAVGMSALIAAFAVFTRAFATAHDTAWARYSAATGIAFLVLGGLGAAVGDWRLVAAAIVLGWSWASLVAWRLQTTPGRAGPAEPNCAARSPRAAQPRPLTGGQSRSGRSIAVGARRTRCSNEHRTARLRGCGARPWMSATKALVIGSINAVEA